MEVGGDLLIIALAVVTSTLGAIGGLGGAIILVPLLTFGGMSITSAAPLGLVSVIAGSVAAGRRQASDGTVNHRFAVVTELGAASGAVVGVLLSGVLSERVLLWCLAMFAIAAALLGARRKGMRWQPDTNLTVADVGERPGSLSGAYLLDHSVVPYTPSRMPLGVCLMALAGVVTGLAGVGGGFLKTPLSSEVMRLPAKVAAGTSTFTIGLTASVALVLMAIDGRIVAADAALVVLGSLVGGTIGARVQTMLSPPVVRRTTAVALVAIAIVLVIRA
ncbi:MAG: sulfite exporter TauE/SafE family protein [Actinobacteria bacterium]|nr:sulfite exporter TauE/SafE family protein [Actinomycetota bacterium]